MNKNTIDFLSDWQNHFAFGLGEVIFSEKTQNNEIIRELIMSTNQFDKIVDYYNCRFKYLSKKSIIYRYFNRNYKDEEENRAINDEVKIEDINEFITHLKNINIQSEQLLIVLQEYEALLNFCERIREKNHFLYFKTDEY